MMKKRQDNGFTLVELLVVIGIIALLISILLPTLNSARAAAKQTQCLSAQRQIVQGMVQYSLENKGYLTPLNVNDESITNPAATDTFRWYSRQLVGRFMGNTSNEGNYSSTRSFYCPSMAVISAPSRPNTYGHNVGIGYVDRNDANLYWRFDPGTAGVAGSYWKPTAGSLANPPLKLPRMRESSRLMLIADVLPDNGTLGEEQNAAQSYRWFRAYVGDASGRAVFAGQNSAGATAYRHNKRANVGFADGHAESFTSTQRDSDVINTHKDKGLHAAIVSGQVRIKP